MTYPKTMASDDFPFDDDDKIKYIYSHNQHKRNGYA